MNISGNSGVDRIELMQTFVRIVEAGSLSAAAQQLGTSQPTVSRRLQTLERALGLKLLQRSTHGMKLTEDGNRCFAHAKELLGSWNAIESDLRGATSEPEGTLRVLAPHAFGQDHLIAPLTDYLKHYSHVTVEWLLHDRRPDFISEDIDCSIQVGMVENPSLVAIRLFEVPRIVVASPSLVQNMPLPIRPEDLQTLPWLAFRTFYYDKVSLVHQTDGEVRHFSIRPRLSTDSLYALRNTMLTGLGAGIISAWMVADDIEQGRLLRLAPEWNAPSLPVYIVYPYANFYPAKLRLFVEAIRKRQFHA